MAKKIKIVVTSLLLVGILAALNFTDFSKRVRNFFYLISQPLQKALWQAGDRTSDFIEGIWQADNLKNENESLQSKIQEITAENAKLRELKKENEFLKEALDLGLEKEFELKLASIIAKDIDQDVIAIDKGSRDGLTANMPVVSQSKILLGKISQVYDNFSKVQLLTEKSNVFDVKIQNKEIYGLAKGGGGGFKLSLDLVPQEKEVASGDLALTSAMGGIFPNNLLVGQVVKAQKSDIKPFQEIEIKPSFDIKELDFLLIIVNYAKKSPDL